MFNFAFPWLPDVPGRSDDRNGQPVAFPEAWMTPTIVTYAGDRAIEERVVTEVASFGRQIGILSEALLEIADGEPGKAVERLRSVVTRVETVKSRFSRALEENAEDAFMALLNADPIAAERLVDALERRVAENARQPAQSDGDNAAG
ncbi:MAG TPA: hypothetical protein VMP03_09080 [Methylomirabilota bacterium]|nr:hypothetical protein [Methylomirabilota bacterium]